jgi:precorrin-4 C11-methyltransferase
VKDADLIIYAGSLINPEILDNAGDDAEKLNSAAMSLDEVVEAIKTAHLQGKSVLRLHSGDPAMYGAISEQMNALDELEIEYEVIPGVSSVFAAAAALKTELTMPGITQTVILTRREGRTPVPESEHIAKLAANGASVAVFLSVADMPGLVADFISAGRSPETAVGIVYRASWPNQKIIRGTLADIAEKVKKSGIKRQAMIIVGNAIKRTGEKSLLYDDNFAHGFRSDGKSARFTGSTAIFAITETGCQKAAEIAEGLPVPKIFVPERFAGKCPKAATFAPKTLSALIAENWNAFDAHIFIMATGIVVRKITGLLDGKLTDPAVVVCDELGNNVISLISGHIGGANRLAEDIAGITGGRAVITTATDVNKLMAFDELATINNWRIINPEMIKTLNSMLLEGKKIDLLLPKNVFSAHYENVRGIRSVAKPADIAGDAAVILDAQMDSIAVPTLAFSSSSYAVGIGCRKNVSAEEILSAYSDALKKAKIDASEISLLASSDVKKDETGLLEFAKKLKLKLKFFSKETLNAIETPNFSQRAMKEFGVSSVSEAAAIAASNSDTLILEKQKYPKVTIAIAK